MPDPSVSELVALLRKIEWAQPTRVTPQCPCCHGNKDLDPGLANSGHVGNCELKRLLDAAQGEGL